MRTKKQGDDTTNKEKIQKLKQSFSEEPIKPLQIIMYL